MSSKCNICNGRGIYIKNGVAYRCNCTKYSSYYKKYKNSNLTGILKYQTFENFNFNYYPNTFCRQTNCTYLQAAKRVVNAAKSFCFKIEKGHTNTKGLLLYGAVGSGKTYLAASIANRLLSQGINVLFTVVPDLLDTIKATYDSDSKNSGESEMQILEGARNVPLLILDDLGAHNYTLWTRNKIYSIINYRVNMQLPTVLTTNEDMDTLEKYLGERTTSRISQLCNMYMLFTPTDIRITKNKEHNIVK